MTGIVAGGAVAYESALRAQYEAARKELEARLEKCSDAAEREIVARELQNLEKDLESRLYGIGCCLF